MLVWGIYGYSARAFSFSKSKNFPRGDFEMQVEIEEVRATKTRDIHYVRYESNTDYQKAKWMLSEIPVTWAANDFTRTLYFLGKKF